MYSTEPFHLAHRKEPGPTVGGGGAWDLDLAMIRADHAARLREARTERMAAAARAASSASTPASRSPRLAAALARAAGVLSALLGSRAPMAG